MKLSALCTDIDGTLLNSHRELSVRTITAIKGLGGNIPIILASSRMPSAMRHLQRELDILRFPLICYNGGYVIQFEDGFSKPRVIDSVQIPIQVLNSVLESAAGKDIHVSLYHEDNWYAPHQDQWTAREARITKVSPTIVDLASIVNEWRVSGKGAHKIMCMGPEEEIHGLQSRLAEISADHLHLYRSKSTYLEIAPRAVSKATALKLLLEKLYFLSPSEVIAFGDNYNDIDLIQSVGLGIAVENARDEVKAVAKEVTLNSKDDGVAAAIEKHFKTGLS